MPIRVRGRKDREVPSARTGFSGRNSSECLISEKISSEESGSAGSG